MLGLDRRTFSLITPRQSDGMSTSPLTRTHTRSLVNLPRKYPSSNRGFCRARAFEISPFRFPSSSGVNSTTANPTSEWASIFSITVLLRFGNNGFQTQRFQDVRNGLARSFVATMNNEYFIRVCHRRRLWRSFLNDRFRHQFFNI